MGETASGMANFDRVGTEMTRLQAYGHSPMSDRWDRQRPSIAGDHRR
jgi:hypothetical protein